MPIFAIYTYACMRILATHMQAPLELISGSVHQILGDIIKASTAITHCSCYASQASTASLKHCLQPIELQWTISTP